MNEIQERDSENANFLFFVFFYINIISFIHYVKTYGYQGESNYIGWCSTGSNNTLVRIWLPNYLILKN